MANPVPFPEERPVGPAASSSESGGDAATASGFGNFDVFVSYNSRDHVLVTELAEGMSGKGLKPFLDRWDLAPGLRWRPELERVLAACGSVVVMLGPHGLGEVQQREVDVALRRQDKDPRFPVVPVLLPGGEPPGGFLEQLTWVDVRDQATSAAVENLVGVLRNEWGADVQRKKARTNRRRYLANLLILLAVLGVLTGWYLRHLESARFGPVAVGGSIGLPTLLWLAILYFRWGAEDEFKNLPRRLLGSPHSTRGLLVALGLSLGLFAATSSIRVEAASTASSGEAYSVEVRSGAGKVLWRSPSLTADRPVASRLFFFLGRQPGEVLLNPAGDRASMPVRLGPASRVRVRVPDQFTAKPVNVLRVLPGKGLLALLGRPGSGVDRVYDLEVEAGGAPVRIRDVRRRAYYLAGADGDIATGLRREREDERKGRFEGWARNRLHVPEALTEGVVSMWMDAGNVVGWMPPASLDAIRFELFPDGGTEAEPLGVTVLDATNDIRTVIVDRTE
ncbi:MAG: toll/interleukin-1 receptor domain-containing protein [Limisphaerales bacterium]